MKVLAKSVCAVAMMVAVSAPAFAHHSYGMFDRTREKVLVGTVESFEWTNPHSWVHMLVPDGKGQVVKWAAEMGPPGQLARTGWKFNTLKPGDKVELTMNPLKDGTPGGHLIQVKTADGSMYYDVVFRKPPTSPPPS